MVFENSMGECSVYLGDSYAGGVDNSTVVESIATTMIRKAMCEEQ